jgi:hypothetical protein
MKPNRSTIGCWNPRRGRGGPFVALRPQNHPIWTCNIDLDPFPSTELEYALAEYA